jgi:hypothetical protein
MTLKIRLFPDSIGLAVMFNVIELASMESAFDLLASPDGVAVHKKYQIRLAFISP